ncbi:MAG: UDP-N-acetylmuramate--L-alanine ligase [Candidatus Magnetoovum sp. WYHC-5]|nr:UDP-N-acetylmuramate--L-alanine ligase [Candidatus Magnetoovum sp. WYHC-5]
MFNHYRVIHFVGIGGIGMSGIAQILKGLGYEVTGSDVKESAITSRLQDMGIEVNIGHRASNVNGAHVVVVSSAIDTANPEIDAARRKNIPVIPRAEMLAEIGRLKYGVLIAGSHGKTTTTSIISTVLKEAGHDPTVVIGGKLISTDSNVSHGKGEFFVAEADESDGSFLKLNPTIAVCTNIDKEHMEYFGNMDKLRNAFVQFLNKVPFYGQAVVCLEDENVRSIVPYINRSYVTYGFSHEAHYNARNIDVGFLKTSYELYRKDEFLGDIFIPLSGRHNILNSLAAVAVGRALGVDLDTIKKSLNAFKGIKRRLEFKGEVNGIKVYDDYGHHPTEIMMTMKGIKDSVDNRLVVVFQPHRYTRTRDLFEEFAGAFNYADKLYLLDIYAAGEMPIDGINSEKIYTELRKKGVDVSYVKNIDDVLMDMKAQLKSGDLFVTFGAGDVWKIGENFLQSMYMTI